MRLGEFRKLTEDLPDSAFLWVLDGQESKAWKMPVSLEVVDTQVRYIESQDVPETMKRQIEIRLKS